MLYICWPHCHIFTCISRSRAPVARVVLFLRVSLRQVLEGLLLDNYLMSIPIHIHDAPTGSEGGGNTDRRICIFALLENVLGDWFQ